MTKKRKKLEAALEKLKEQRAEIESKIKETEDLIVEETNTEIHEIVHKANVTPEQLAEILKTLGKNTVPGNFSLPGAKEETANENE
ncbi:MAG: DUF4315 family protein [Lachnospiraceae bacterium]|nr:DUF4315 family protein [Lachnospiraceae bacterium]